MQSFLTVIVFALLSTVLSSCSQFTTHLDTPPPDINTTFATSYGEVLSTYGPPSQIHTTPTGFYFLYENVKIKENQIGLSLDFLIPDIFSFVFGRGSARLQSLLVGFNSTGMQTSLTRSDWDEDLGKGSGLQFIFTPLPLVDDSSLRVTAPQNQWGTELLLQQDDDIRVRLSDERLILLGTPLLPTPPVL